MPKPDLDSAYALKTPDDNKRLYADWAETYDDDFAASMDFILPGRVARAFADAGGTGPVLDVGAGTGLLGEALAGQGIAPVDATDLSPEMLAVAGRKGVYRALIAGNLLEGLDLPDGSYAGVVSSGTFTLGHLGPEPLPELLRLVAPNAVLALSINKQHFAEAGFEAAFERMGDKIADLTLEEVANYGPGAQGPHKDDTCFVARFRKAVPTG